jgi:hypothetical protein
MMDCLDCHNTIGHPMAPTPETRRGRGHRLRTGEPAASLHAARGGTADDNARRRQALARAASALQDVYRRNVFPAMKMTWRSYPDNKGHITSNGCFRCHDGSHAASDGSTINADCEYCHKQID